MASRAALLLTIALLAATCIATPLPANAAPKTIVVPDNYPTISGAISNATNGDTVYVKNGVYPEFSLVIKKSIWLVGEDAKSTVICLDSPSHDEINWLYQNVHWHDPAMTVNTNDFKLSGFTITTTGGDISITGNRSKITGNSITADLSIQGSHAEVLENTLIRKNSKGVTATGDWLNILANHVTEMLSVRGKNNIISFNHVNGSLIAVTDYSFIFHNTLYSEQYGEFSVSGDDNIISKNVVDHLRFGLAVTGSNNKALLNQITRCQMGISPSAGNTYYANYIADTSWPINPMNRIINPAGNSSVLIHNNFVNNQYYQVTSLVMPNTTDYFDDGREGNYWSDYNGTDENGDGIGDTPFYLDSTHLDRYPLISPFNLSSVAELIPEWLSIPSVQLTSPEKTTYSLANITLVFIVDKQVSWQGYSLDGQDNLTISANTTITDLPNGLHNITVYANDTYGNMGASETVSFNVAVPASFPVVAVAFVAILTVVLVSACLFLYSRKRRKKAGKA